MMLHYTSSACLGWIGLLRTRIGSGWVQKIKPTSFDLRVTVQHVSSTSAAFLAHEHHGGRFVAGSIRQHERVRDHRRRHLHHRLRALLPHLSGGIQSEA